MKTFQNAFMQNIFTRITRINGLIINTMKILIKVLKLLLIQD